MKLEPAALRLRSKRVASKAETPSFWTPCVVNVGIGFTGVDGKRLKAAVLDHHLKIFKINLNHYSMDGVCLTSIVKSWIELVYAVIGGI